MKITVSALSFVLVFLTPGVACAQALNPSYLKEMPPVDRVMNDMKAADPDETAARQMGAFLQLKKMIEDAAGPRMFSRTNGLTPDETRIRQQYYTAYYQISQIKPVYKTLNGPRGYDIDPKFRDQLFQKYFSPAFRAQVDGANAPALARAAARNQANAAAAREMMKSSPPPMPGPPPAKAGTTPVAAAPVASTPAAQPGSSIVSTAMGNQPGCVGSIIAAAFCMQGYEYLATNDLTDNDDAVAQNNFSSASQNDASIADVQSGLGMLAYNHMHYDTAAGHFKQYTTLRPQDAEGFLELGLTYYELRQYPQAADALRKAVALKPADPGDAEIAAKKLALAAAGKGPAPPPAGDKAAALVKQAQDDWSGVHDSNSDVNTDYQNAVTAYKAAMTINPKMEEAYLGLGVTAWEDMQGPEALAALLQATRLAPEDRRAWCQLGIVYFNANHYADAVTALAQADNLRANDVCLEDLGKSYVALGKKADALRIYKKLEARNKELAFMLNGAIQSH